MDLKLAVILFVCVRIFKVLAEDLDEGSMCKMEDGIKGICLKLSDCPHVQKELKDLGLVKYCKQGLFSEPIVCCLDCQFIQNRFLDEMVITMKMSVDFLFDFQFTDSSKTKKPNRCLHALTMANLQKFPCNKYEEFKDLHDSVLCYDSPIESDTVVDPEINVKRNYNHHLALIGYGDHPDVATWSCSGSVISKKHILTAAHCTRKNSDLGVIKLAALGVVQYMDNNKNWQVYGIVKIINHPAYAPPSKYDDIALLETGNQIMFNREVIPACLHRGQEVGILATTMGWRSKPSQRNSPANILREATIKKYSDAECYQAYPSHRFLRNGYMSAAQVCYGDRDQPDDICEADTGGPLQVKNNMKNSKCLYTIVGVTSIGRACGFFGTPGLFTKVNFYLPWIESITGQLS